MADDSDLDDEAPLKDGQRILTPKGEYGTVFWSYPEGNAWRVYYLLDDGTNDNALHTELTPDEYAPPMPTVSPEPDCVRCATRTSEYEIPALLCEPCWKEWLYKGWAN